MHGTGLQREISLVLKVQNLRRLLVEILNRKLFIPAWCPGERLKLEIEIWDLSAYGLYLKP